MAKLSKNVRKGKKAYFMFFVAHRPQILVENPHDTPGEVAKKVGVAWRRQHESEREAYREREREDKARFDREMAVIADQALEATRVWEQERAQEQLAWREQQQRQHEELQRLHGKTLNGHVMDMRMANKHSGKAKQVIGKKVSSIDLLGLDST